MLLKTLIDSSFSTQPPDMINKVHQLEKSFQEKQNTQLINSLITGASHLITDLTEP